MKKMKRWLGLSLMAVFAFIISVSSVACRGGANGGIKIDPNRTQLYVSSHAGGFGSDWLTAASARFEEYYKDTSFESGKTGVQIIPDTPKTIGTGLLADIKNNRNNVIFTESVYYYDYIAAGENSDLTEREMPRTGIHPDCDYFIADCAAEIIRRFSPDLIMLHPANVDGVRHGSGAFGEEVDQAVKDTDNLIGIVCRAAEAAGWKDKFNFILVSDHGQMDMKRVINTNTLFADLGWIETDDDGNVKSWRAKTISSAFSSYVILKDPSDEKFKREVACTLSSIVKDGLYGFGEVLDEKQARERYGLYGNFSFVIETDDFTGFGDDVTHPTLARCRGYERLSPGMGFSRLYARKGAAAGVLRERSRIQGKLSRRARQDLRSCAYACGGNGYRLLRLRRARTHRTFKITRPYFTEAKGKKDNGLYEYKNCARLRKLRRYRMDIKKIVEDFQNCVCGKKHTVGIREVVVGSGVTKDAGKILKRNGFGKNLLLVADENTLRAAEGLVNALLAEGFTLSQKIYENLRVADMREVEKTERLLQNADGVIAVGTGSVHDTCRMASARQKKLLCLFPTAASMDGFASYNAPLTDHNFKITYAAKTPEVIIADTKVLVNAPDELKSAGFGDMVGKYVALIDWQVSNLVSGEYYCPKVAELTRNATDKIMSIADQILSKEESAAKEVFEALLLTGIGMAFTQNSRPASGTEHILSHFWECIELSHHHLSDFHGKKVGVATLLIMDEYEKMVQKEKITAHKEVVDWDEVYRHYGDLADEVRKLNTPDTITDSIAPETIEKNWPKIREIVKSVPSRKEIYDAMKLAGCVTDCSEIGVSEFLKNEGLRYHPYMRRRVSLMRLKNMID